MKRPSKPFTGSALLRTSRRVHAVFIALALAGLSGCAQLPELKLPRLEWPPSWRGHPRASAPDKTPPAPEREATPALPAVTAATATAAAVAPSLPVAGEPLSQWWKHYRDPLLDALIDEALSYNRDLRHAAARIDEARASLGIARSAQSPGLQASASTGYTRSTEKGSFPVADPASPNIKLNLQAAYEIDLWGRYQAASDSARAELLGSEFARETVRTSLIAQIAKAYFSLVTLDRQLAVNHDTLANRREVAALHALRWEKGIASELPLRQSEADIAALESARAVLSARLRQQELALGVLLGREPRHMLEERILHGEKLPHPAQAPDVPAGLPSELLNRRPDLRQAEQNLRAAHARIAEVKAALYPGLALTAHFGSESKHLADLFTGPAAIWGIGASVAQTLFNAGRTEAGILAADARQQQAVMAYEQTVRQAFRETLDALVVQRQIRAQSEALDRQSEALARSLELADLRYRNGLDNYLQVLDAQRALYATRQSALDLQLASLTASVDLNRALGGGWEAKP